MPRTNKAKILIGGSKCQYRFFWKFGIFILGVLLFLVGCEPCFAANYQVIVGGTNVEPSTSAARYTNLFGIGNGTGSGPVAWSASTFGMYVPTAGVLSDFAVNLQQAPDNGAGTQSWKFSIYYAGAEKTLSVTISEGATSGTQTSNPVTIAAGNLLCIMVTPSGTPAATNGIAWSCKFTPTTANETIFGGDMSWAKCGHQRFVPIVGLGDNATAANRFVNEIIIPSAGTLKNLYVKLSANVGSDNTFTVYQNGISTSMACVIASGASSAFDTVNTLSITAGDRIALYSTTADANESKSMLGNGFVFLPASAGEFFIPAVTVSYPSTSATNYFPICGGDSSFTTTESTAYGGYNIDAFVVKAIYAGVKAAPGAGKSWTYSLRISGANNDGTNSCSVTISGACTAPCYANAASSPGNVNIVAGKLLDSMIVPAGTPATFAYPQISYLCDQPPAPTATLTATQTATPTLTRTPTLTLTLTPTLSISPTITITPELTPTDTITATLSETATPTPTTTQTLSPTITATNTLTPSLTATATPTVTATPVNYYVCNNATTANACGSGWSLGSDSNNGKSKSSPFLTIGKAITDMSGGDICTIATGIYTGTANQIDDIDSGNAGLNTDPTYTEDDVYTIIQADPDCPIWSVRLDGVNGVSDYLSMLNISTRNYWIVKGIFFFRGDGYVEHSNYFKIQKDAFCEASNSSGQAYNLGITGSSYWLVEQCIAFGEGRYQFGTITPIQSSDKGIFRQCVGRIDYFYENYGMMANYANYEQSNIYFQNCIAIDSLDYQSGDGEPGNPIAGFMGPNGNVNTSTYIEGCIVLNHWGGAYQFESEPGMVSITNSVAWDIHQSDSAGGWGYMIYIGSDSGNNILSYLTIGQSNTFKGSYHKEGVGNSVWDNSIIAYHTKAGDPTCPTCSGYGANRNFATDYCDFYGNLVDGNKGTNYSTVNPLTSGLLYLPRIEDGSVLKTAGSGGGQIGATILYKIGVEGTLYGETGWNTTTADPLWKFPNEDRIRELMSDDTYNLHGIDFQRGFCDNNQKAINNCPVSLTSYIWEYLGNPNPYGNPPCPTPTPTVTITATDTETATPTQTPTNTPTNTPTQTITETQTLTPTLSPTLSSTPSLTSTRTPTLTPTRTPTQTVIRTPTITATATPTFTLPPLLEEVNVYRFYPYEENNVFRYSPYEEIPVIRFVPYEEITVYSHRR